MRKVTFQSNGHNMLRKTKQINRRIILFCGFASVTTTFLQGGIAAMITALVSLYTKKPQIMADCYSQLRLFSLLTNYKWFKTTAMCILRSDEVTNCSSDFKCHYSHLAKKKETFKVWIHFSKHAWCSYLVVSGPQWQVNPKINPDTFTTFPA